MPQSVKPSDFEDQLSPAANAILSEVNGSVVQPNKGVPMEETPWQGRYPNLYGALGAAKEVGKTLLPYVKYIDPSEREKFMQLSQQEQVRDLLLEDLNMVTLGHWKPIAAGAKAVAGAAMETFLPKTFDALTKARTLPSASMKSLENVLAPVDKPTLKPVKPNQTVGDIDDTFKKVKSLQENWDGIVEKQRRGTRPHETARTDAESIGYKYDDIKNMSPGTTLNDAQIVALTDVVKTVADDVFNAAKAGDLKTFLNKFIALGEIDPARLGVKAETGRSLSIMNEPVSGINQYIDQFANLLAQGNITPELLMARAAKLKTPAQLAELAKAAQRPGFTDAIVEVWINGLLSGPATHAANIAGNAVMLSAQIPERGIAAAFGKILPGEAEVKFGEIPRMFYGLIEGLKDGFRLGAKALMEGKPQTGGDKIEWKKGFIAESFGINDETGLGKSINLLGELIRTPGRGLLAADEFFKGVAGRMELRANSYRQGIENGFQGEDLARFINGEINKPGQQTKDAVSQFQKYITFQKDLGEKGQKFQDLVSGPVGKLLFPFVRTPANIFKAFGERTPFAVFSKNVRADIASGGARRDLALARISLGSTISAITASYVADGTITGGGPHDKNLRAAMMREGWQPYSIRINGTYYSYARLEPLSTLLGVTASSVELMNQIEGDEIDANEIPFAIMAAMSKNVLDKTFTQGIANVILAIEEPKQYGKQYIYQLTGSAVPAFSAQLSRSIESDVKEVNSVLDSVKSRIPGLSKDVPSKVDLWGEKIEVDTLGPMFLSPIRKMKAGSGAAIDKEIVDNKISISPADKKLFGVKLTPEEYHRYCVLAGNEAKASNGLGLKESLTKLISTPYYQRQSGGPEGGKSLLIRAQITYYRELAAIKMLNEYPELAAAVKLKGIEKTQNLKPIF